jgi:hypothetical protein
MAGRKEIAIDGEKTRFSSANQPGNQGRRPSMLKAWIKESGVSGDDIITIFKNLIANYTLGELKRMVEGENKNNLPVIAVLGISALLHDMKTGTLTATNSVLDRVIGKPTQHVETNGSVTLLDSRDIEKQIKDALKEIREKNKNEQNDSV